MSHSGQQKNEKAACLQAALRLLAQREHGADELAVKLGQRGYTHQPVAAALEKCQQNGWQSDERFAHSMVRYRSGKGDGPRKIAQYLIYKGIDSCIVEQAISEEPIDWFMLARKVRMQKFAVIPTDWKARQKCQHYLFQKGFDSAMIHYALDD